MTDQKRSRLTDAAALLGLAGLTLAFFWKIALTSQVLAGVDVFSYFYPYRELVSEALRAARLPLWNPYLFMGAPLLANSQAAALYPLHWPFLWLAASKQVAWSMVLHVWLAGAGAYLLARRSLQMRPLGAFVAAAAFGMGGFLGAQVEHLNQLNASAWLPWLLMCVDSTRAPGRWRRRGLLAGSVVASLVLLAGHTQAAYIVFAGAAVYSLARGLPDFTSAAGRKRLRGLVGPACLAGMIVAGAVLAAGQLLPAWELSRLSVRSGGLPYQEAASFSLKPGLIFQALLPPLVWDPPFSEYVAYIGVAGVALAAAGVWITVRRLRPSAVDGEARRWFNRPGSAALALAVLGLFLAFGAYNPFYYLLYKVVPGFDLFRAPARWLLLYGFGTGLVAGLGLDALPKGRWLRRGAAILLIVELFTAGRKLAYNRPTAPAAVDSMRSAPAHLLAQASDGPYRFLSMSDITYDPGDLADLSAAYAPFLPDDAVYGLIVATKMKEVLAYNLPASYHLSSVDGYDGGLLPTARYVALESLFLAPDEIWSDGRLRQQLRTIPDARLLSMLNVRYVITDKSQDVWHDGVYYDLEHSVDLSSLTLSGLPDFETTHLGLVSYLTGTEALAEGTPVARVTVTAADGSVRSHTLRAGIDTALGRATVTPGSLPGPLAIHRWRAEPEGSDYLTTIALDLPVRLSEIRLTTLLAGGTETKLVLRGLSLMDERTHTSRTVSVDPRYRQVHSGDVKIYENRAALPRAFVVYRASVQPDDGVALARLRDPQMNPTREVVLASGRELSGEQRPPKVDLLKYLAERVEVSVELEAPGYLVLADAFYPGWEAEVDGEPAPILRANVYFRAVALEPGRHQVTFRFNPSSVRIGLAWGAAAWVVWALAVLVTEALAGRNRPHRVYLHR